MSTRKRTFSFTLADSQIAQLDLVPGDNRSAKLGTLLDNVHIILSNIGNNVHCDSPQSNVVAIPEPKFDQLEIEELKSRVDNLERKLIQTGSNGELASFKKELEILAQRFSEIESILNPPKTLDQLKNPGQKKLDEYAKRGNPSDRRRYSDTLKPFAEPATDKEKQSFGFESEEPDFEDEE